MTNSYTPKHPYLLRAFHEWLEDNQLTPYLMIDANHADIVAPTQYAQDGKLVLNISYSATKDLFIDNEGISFSARFGGVSQDIWLPMSSLLALYAKEDTMQAIAFDPNDYRNATSNVAPKLKSNNKSNNKPKPQKGSKKDDKKSVYEFKIIK